jgi:hypothetical protein
MSGCKYCAEHSLTTFNFLCVECCLRELGREYRHGKVYASRAWNGLLQVWKLHGDNEIESRVAG